MTVHNKKAIERAKQDPLFARILLASDPKRALDKQQEYMWIHLTEQLTTTAWVIPAMDIRAGKFKDPSDYSDNPNEIKEIETVQDFFRRYSEYASLLAGTGVKPFTDYLNGMSVVEFIQLLQPLTGMDAARAIQKLYKERILDDDLGGSQLHRYMEELGLPYIPTVNHLNAARRGEISKGRGNKNKS